jgi:hypothetical protein
MSQEDVLKFLEKHMGKWFTSRQIWSGINRKNKPSLNTTTHNLKLLRECSMVTWIYNDGSEVKILYTCKSEVD